MKKIGKVIGCIWPMVAYLLLQSLGALVIGIAVALPKAMQMIGQSDDVDAATQAFMNWYSVEVVQMALVGGTIFSAAIAVIWFMKYRKEDVRPVRDVISGHNIGLLLVFAIVLQVFVGSVMYFANMIFPEALAEYGELIETAGIGTSVPVILMAIFIAPIGEETIFRGIIYAKARRFLPFLAANILQALLFGILHMNVVQGSYAFCLGLALGLVRYRYQNILYPILLHMFFNVLGQTIPYIYPENTYFYIIAGVLGLVITIWIAKKIMLQERIEEVPAALEEGIIDSNVIDFEIGVGQTVIDQTVIDQAAISHNLGSSEDDRKDDAD